MSYDSEAEAREIMHVKHCIMTSAENKNAIGLVYDTITGAYLMTSDVEEVGINLPDGKRQVAYKPSQIDIDTFMRCIDAITEKEDLCTLLQRGLQYRLFKLPDPLPGIKPEEIPPKDKLTFLDLYRIYGMKSLPGRLLFSAVLPADFVYEKYNSNTKNNVIIIDGILVSGTIAKEHVGPYVHRSIVQMIHKNHGVNRTVGFLTDAPFLINVYLNERGFTVGPEDCQFKNLDQAKMIKEEIIKTKTEVESFGPPLDDPLEEAYREQQIKMKVRDVKNFGVKIAKEAMQGDNNLRVMISDVGGGAKGSSFNVAQSIGLLGQQFFKGKRIEKTITNGTRCLPHFPRDSQELEATGFCTHSFWEGLSPTELFFHHYGTREGILDTAMNTQQSGDMHHRIVKALENIAVFHDGSVRNKVGTVFELVYGLDGFGAENLVNIPTEGGGQIPFFVDFDSTAKRLNSKYGWIQEKVLPKE